MQNSDNLVAYQEKCVYWWEWRPVQNTIMYAAIGLLVCWTMVDRDAEDTTAKTKKKPAQWWEWRVNGVQRQFRSHFAAGLNQSLSSAPISPSLAKLILLVTTGLDTKVRTWGSSPPIWFLYSVSRQMQVKSVDIVSSVPLWVCYQRGECGLQNL